MSGVIRPTNTWQPHPVHHPPLEAPSNDLEIVWIDEVPHTTWIDQGVITTASLLALGSALLIVMPIVALPTVGATRSTRLRWVARQADINQALAEQQAYLQSCEDGAASEPNGPAADVDQHE
jgi:hypothetical protein